MAQMLVVSLSFFEAFQTFRSIVFNSSKESQAEDKIQVTPFLLDSKSENEPYFL